MKKPMIVLAIALCAFAGYAAKTYTIDVADGTRTEPVALDAQNVVIYDSETGQSETKSMSDVTFEAGSTFCKRGVGFVHSSARLGTLKGGEIRIAEGALVVNAVGQLGDNSSTESAPAVYVVDGAAFVIAMTTANPTPFKNVFHLAGTGVGGATGALVLQSTAVPGYAFDADICLDSDATICSFVTQRYDMGGGKAIRLNGHRLTFQRGVSSVSPTWGLIGCDVLGAGDAGGIVVKAGFSLLAQLGSSAVWEGTAQNEIVLQSGATLMFYSNSYVIPWTLHAVETSTFDVSAGSAPEWGAMDNNFYSGPVQVDSGATLTVKRHWDQTHPVMNLTFAGPLTGSGTIAASDLWLHLAGTGNAFSGNLTVTKGKYESGLAFWKDGLASAQGMGTFKLVGADLKLVEYLSRWNGSASAYRRQAGEGLANLPELTYEVPADQTATFDGGTNGTVATLVKTGEGALKLDSPVNVPGRIDIRAGSVKIGRFAGAGLVGSRVYASNSDNAKNKVTLGYNESLWYIIGNHAYYNSEAYKSNALYRAELGFDIANDIAHPLTVATQAEQDYWGYNAVYYGGYIWNRSAETKTWTIAGGFGSHTHVYLDGTRIATRTAYNVGFCETFEVTPGSHKIEMRSYDSTMVDPTCKLPLGYNFGNLSWCPSNPRRLGAGLRIDFQGRESTAYADYEVAKDPGDGSLFTQTEDGSVALAANATFSGVKFARGTSLDVNGNSYSLDTVEGAGAFANGNAYFSATLTVTNVLKVTAADIAVGAKLSVKGKLVFAADTEVAVDDFKALPRSTPDQPLTLATATDGIEGLPSLKENPDGRWNVAVSNDGKDLVLWREPRGLCIILR